MNHRLEKVKLLYIANARIPTEKAHGLQILKMCEAFRGLGFDVELIHPFRFQSKRMRGLKDIWTYFGIERKFKITRLFSPDFVWLDRFLPEIVSRALFHLQSIAFALEALVYTSFMRRALYFTRDIWVAYFFTKLNRSIIYESHDYPRSKFRQKLIRRCSTHLKGLVTNTRKLAEFYYQGLGIPKEKILYAPNGVDLKRFDLNISKEEARQKVKLPLDAVLALYVGRFHILNQAKGLSVMMRSLRYLPHSLKMVFVGGPVEMGKRVYSEIALEEGIHPDQVIFTDHVAPTLVALYLKAADVLVIPFPKMEQFAYYVSPIKLFEYMASGRPIVASDLPSIRDIVRDGETAILVEPGNPKALAEGIKRVLDDPDLAKRISGQAYDEVQQYTWTERARKIIEFIEVKGWWPYDR